jgi:hypothetical protein
MVIVVAPGELTLMLAGYPPPPAVITFTVRIDGAVAEAVYS